MKILMNRESVCMGDDVNDHRKEMEISDDAAVTDLFNLLKQIDYFPSVSGNDVVWALENKKYKEIFVYFTKADCLEGKYPHTSLSQLNDGTNEFYLVYYGSPAKFQAKEKF